MRNAKFFPVFVLLVAVLLLSAGITIARSQGAEPVQQGSSDFELRAETVNAALAQNNLFDCATYYPDLGSVLPVDHQIFQIVRDVKITPDDGREYMGAVWSPDGNAMVLVVPTDGYRDILDSDALPSDDETRLVAISRNELMLYFPNQNVWDQITSDGARPTWSTDAQSIYYMMGTDLMKFDLNTRTAIYAGLRAPYTAVGLLFSRPLPDGRLLAPRQPHAPLEIQGGKTPALSPIEVADSDHIVLSPWSDQVVVGYGANTFGGHFVPAVTVLHHPNGEITPLLKNCHFSAIEMVWSPTGKQIAYPTNTDIPEIRIYDVESGQTRVLVRLDTGDLLSGLSWSPDGKFLAFTQGDDRSTPRSIWVVSTNGAMRQRLTEGGLLPNWSPDGRHILYARPSADRLLDWYLLEYTAVEAEGG